MKLVSTFAGLLKRLAAPLVVALAVIFAFGPVADGLVCGPDDDASLTQVLAANSGEQTPPNSDIDEHALCSHGHCHHGSMAIPGSNAADAEPLLTAEASPTASSAAISSAYLSSVERPPRA